MKKSIEMLFILLNPHYKVKQDNVIAGMFRKQVIFLNFFLAFGFFLQAQVKIGDNPNAINANSLLELESTNKGFLPPRVALTSTSSPSPLTGPIPTGMIVYSLGGAISNGTYLWNGTSWGAFAMNNSGRTNYVLVKSAADFPAPVSGVITLVSGTYYEVNGTVTLPASINLNGCSLEGRDASNDKLVYTGSTELFTGSGTGSVQRLTLTSATGKVFNLNAGGAPKNMIVQNCFFIACNDVGTIQGVGGTIFFQTVAFFYNTNGITFQNSTNVVLSNTLWDNTNQGTYEKFVGAFNVIQILGGDRLVNSATALNISGITSVVAGSIKVVMFVGTGTYVVGTFSNAWEVEATGLNTEKDDVAAGNIYILASSVTSFAAVNTPVKILGTTTAASLFRVSSPGNNRLAYIGAKSRRFNINCSLSTIASGNNKSFSFYIVKNGTILPESRQYLKFSSQVDRGSITLSCTALLATNDYVEVWIENNTDATSATVESLNLSIR